VFTARLTDKDEYLRRAAAEGLGRAGDTSAAASLQTGAGNDPSDMVRAAMQYALQKLGRNYVARLVEFLDDRKTALQVQEYLIELGPAVERELLPTLQEPDPAMRAAVAGILGEIGGDAALAALRDLKDRDKEVVTAASRAAERIRIRRPQ
jgi:HEAT repeat protein